MVFDLHTVSRMTYVKRGLLVFIMATLLAPIASADQGRGRGRGNGRGAAEKADKDEAIVIDRDGHRRVVRDYYRNNALPPGLAKRESLPPGLQKQLRERGELPPGLQKRLTPVPPPLAARLPGLPAYYDRYFLGSDLLVVDTRSNRIVSVIPNIF
jgi:hypothetical protein